MESCRNISYLSTAAQIIAKVAHEGLRPHVPRDCPWDSIMTSCWKQQAADRPEFQSILISLSKIYLKYRPSATAAAVIVRHVSRNEITDLSESSTRKGPGKKSDLHIPETIAVVNNLDVDDFNGAKSIKSSVKNSSKAFVKEGAFMGGFLSFQKKRKDDTSGKGASDDEEEDSSELSRLLQKTDQTSYQTDIAAKPSSKSDNTNLLIKNFDQKAVVKNLDLGPDGGIPSINVTPIRHAIGSDSLKCWSMPITLHTSPVEKSNSTSKVGNIILSPGTVSIRNRFHSCVYLLCSYCLICVADASETATFEVVEKKRSKSTEAHLARAKAANNNRRIPDRDAYFDVRTASRNVLTFPTITIPVVPSTPQQSPLLPSEIENSSSKSLLTESSILQYEAPDRNSSSLPNMNGVASLLGDGLLQKGSSQAGKTSGDRGTGVERNLIQYPAYYIAEDDGTINDRSNVYLFADHSPSLQSKANPSKP